MYTQTEGLSGNQTSAGQPCSNDFCKDFFAGGVGGGEIRVKLVSKSAGCLGGSAPPPPPPQIFLKNSSPKIESGGLITQ